MTSLTAGVAIITYNGLKYLPQQLDSIVAQSRPVSHIVISDDRSTDGTWEYLQTWAQQATIPVKLIRNDEQLGLIRNFEQAIGAVEADIIFSSDQDDVWLPDKVALLAAVFERHPDVLLVHTDATLVDSDGADMGKTLLGELELSESERDAIRSGRAFEVYCRRNLVTGATAAFRASLLALARPLPATMYHDAWLALLAAATGKVQMLETPTIHYRQHGSNLVGVKKHGMVAKMRHLWWSMNAPRPLSQIVDHLISWRADVHTRLAAHPGVAHSHVALATEALAFARRRRSLPRNRLRRLHAVLRDTGDYKRFSNAAWSDAFRDIVNK